MRIKEYLLEEKYHPTEIDEIIVPDRIKALLKGIIESRNIAGYLFSGGPGTGKTTCARAICEILNVDYHMVEASVNNGVDYVRNNIMEIAQQGGEKEGNSVIILDECDYMSRNAQASLRNIINNVQRHCRFILTANYPEKIIPALRNSRLVEIDFNPTREELTKQVAPKMWKRLASIIKMEGWEIEDHKSLQKFMFDNLPNIRYILKSVQIMGNSFGKIPKDISIENNNITPESFRELLQAPYEVMVKKIYSTTQEDLMEFFLKNVEEIVSSENITKALTLTAQFQGMSKGVEEVYTISWLLNLKGISK